jgi:ABC-2 type transport system ATP-binding protein
VFLDEPTAGMDPRARATTWELVRHLSEDGVTVLLTTHAMDEAEHLCHRVAIMNAGRLVASGTPAELTLNASSDETRFSAPRELDCASLAAAVGLPAGRVVEERPGVYLLRADATPRLVADLAIWLRDRDVRLGELRTGRRTLEEVFLQLTSEDGR